MRAGSRVEFQFDANLDINLRLYDPRGILLTRWDRVDLLSLQRVRADSTGQYRLEFDNSFSLFAPKAVDVTYRVVPSGGR